MADVVYTSFKKDIAAGNINLASDTIKVMLVTSSYTANADTHTKRSDITNEVAATGGYTAGGVALANKSMTADTTGHKGVWSADPASWAASTITARGAVLYKSRGGLASADELIEYIDFGADKSSNSGAFTINWNASGILTFG